MRCTARTLLATALLLPLLFSLAVAAEEACIDCHEADHGQEAVHAELECVDCHVNIKEEPHLQINVDKLQGDAICLQCHESALVLADSVHEELECDDCHDNSHETYEANPDVCADCHRKPARLVSRSVHADNAKCVDCHEFGHSISGMDDPQSLIAPVWQIRTCGACHSTPPEIVEDYLISAHGRALLVEGFDDAPSCSHCHGAHDTTASDDNKSPMAHANSPEVCAPCHEATFNVWTQIGAHGKAWENGNEDAPVCITCHTSHDFTSPRDPESHLAFANNCGECHAEYYTSYRVTFHGEASDLNMATAATCADCHQWHRNLPAEHPESSVHPDNLAETCGACHDRTTESFLSFDPHSNPTDRDANPEVWLIWIFMTILLAGVFGFFGIHDLLWLQRSLVGVARGEFKSEPVEGPWVRRFSGTTVGMHVVVMVTFLLLAATGLPLKFHWTGWAQPMVNLFGGIEAARALHRFAAIATFGYAAFHLYNIFTRAKSGEKGLFWGVNSLVPQKQDAIDILRNLRYFVYLGPRPAGDKWTYWEKFDYMAVFWGIPVIGLSGLFLWYPNFFGQLFPGWVLNAAHLIHSEEALLATGFIFVFHFFHTHMRPESFPLDPVIFTGSMPLERFKEERPREYQRLVDAGELDSIIVEAPSKSRMRMAHIFGFAAVTIGMLLAIGIFWALITGWGAHA